MKRLLTPLLLLLAAVLHGQPICRVTHYDEFSGLSQRLVKQVVQDGDGMLWMATWNGLNRFDGYAFTTVKPRVGSGQPVSSDRINDIRLMATGNLWCRVDSRIMVFDTRTYRFIDIHPLIERKLHRRISIQRIIPATGGTTAMQCADGTCLVLDDRRPTEHPRLTTTLPRLPYVKASNRQYAELGKGLPSPLVYACADRYGTIWVVTRDGDIFYTSSPLTPLARYPERITTPEPLFYSLTDRQGNVWLHNNYGAYRLTFGRHPYTATPQEQPAQVRCLYRDRQGRTWLTGRNDATVRLFAADGSPLGYLSPTGTLVQGYTSFGRTVYCMTEDGQGHLWLGCKPDGLLRLTERTRGAFAVEQFRHNAADAASLPSDNVYDLCTDRQGRLWVGTMKGGLCCLTDPSAAQPRFLTVGNTFKGYPQEAMAVRRIVITTGGAMLVATTGGLVVADSRTGNLPQMTFRLHVGEPDRASSLGNVALMDILEDSRHRVFIASESGGVSLITSRNLLDRQLEFRHFTVGSGLSSDIALSLFEHGGRLWVVGNSQLMALQPDSAAAVTYGATFWERPVRFSDAHPLHLGGGRWLLGLQDGSMTINVDSLERDRYVPPIVLTALSVENRADSVAVSRMDTLTLRPDERNLTIRFAALDYADAEQLRYAFRLGEDGQWNDIGQTRSVTLLDLHPGTYRLRLRSTDSRGQWLGNERTLTIIVTPTFWETGWAHALYALAVLLVLAAIGRTVAYIRAIKRKQRETLEAYLKLQEEQHGTPQPVERPALSDEDAQFMQRVTAFMEAHLGDAEASVNDMAAAAAVSRSGLNRRLKAIVGVTPAEFMRETRLQRAATLLATTERTVSEIALDCGFSDQNYFGKCFKARRGLTPSDYRRQAAAR